MDPKLVNKYLKQVVLVRGRSRTLETFGATKIHYHVVSPVEDLKDKTRLREGIVISEKPAILTPEALRERFEGFGEDSAEFAQWLKKEYRDLLRALEYKFRNTGMNTHVIQEPPAAVAARIHHEVEAANEIEAVVIRCPDPAWSLALMRYTLEEAARSFPGNIRDLETRGFFEPGGPEGKRRRLEIAELFAKAEKNADARALLGRKLKDYGMFDEMEDRFLALFP